MNLSAEDYQKAVKSYCRVCSGGSLSQAKSCALTGCALWPLTDWHHQRPTRRERRAEGVQLEIRITIGHKGDN